MSDLSKLLICPYFGRYPDWIDRWFDNTERMRDHGYEFLFDDDEEAFRDRVRDKLGVVAPPMANTGLIHDFRPALGYLYDDEIAGYDWWGTTDFDCVYGRVEKFVTDEILSTCDIYTDCAYSYISGPWSLYRNTAWLREFFLDVPGADWAENLGSPEVTGWCETSFSEAARNLTRLRIDCNHAFTEPEKLHLEGEALMHGDREISYFHFRRRKEWPL